MLTVQYIADIIQTVMGLDDGRVWIYNQRRTIPTDKGLCVVVGMVSAEPFANVTQFNPAAQNTAGATETVTTSMRELVSIDIFSADTTAAARAWEVVAALGSRYAQDSQADNQYKIASVPQAMQNVSELEGASILYRFTMSIPVLRSYSSTSDVTYYDSSSKEIHYSGKGVINA